MYYNINDTIKLYFIGINTKEFVVNHGYGIKNCTNNGYIYGM